MTMESSERIVRRSVPASVLEGRRIDAILQPYLGDLKGWHSRVAYLTSRAVSPYSSAEDRGLARLECGALLAEVRHRRADLQSVTKGEPRHSRLNDVVAAFDRLLEKLEQVPRQ